MQEIVLSADIRSRILGELREFLMHEWDEDVSEFKATLLLDFFLTKLAPSVYNQAVNDAHTLMAARIEDILALEKRRR